MNALSKFHVVNRMTTELAERRRTATTRRAAYLALAQAILADERDVFVLSSAHARRPTVRAEVLAAA